MLCYTFACTDVYLSLCPICILYAHPIPLLQTNALRPAAEARGNPLEQKAGKDHFDAMGFRNDGYDYSKHLKEMGKT